MAHNQPMERLKARAPSKTGRVRHLLAAALCVALTSAHAIAAADTNTIFSFQYNRSGGFPAAGVVQDAEGNLYGTTSSGGGGADDGIVFELSPPSVKGRQWVQTVLYRFSGGSDGSTPDANLTLDPATGNLYGTAQYAFGNLTGVVFQLAPPSSAGGAWTYRVIHAFSGGDGGDPQGELLRASNGTLLGTTSLGGVYDAGVIFRLQPGAEPTSEWTYTVLHNFDPSQEGGNPVGPIATDAGGTLYGLTTSDGAYGDGTAYELIPPVQAAQTWRFRTIHQFSGADGAQSFTGLVRRASDGSLFGGTIFGGDTNLGVVFQLRPPTHAGGSWTEQTVYTFTGNEDGCNPAAVAVNAEGSLFGTTSGLNCPTGTLFQLSQPAANAPWTFQTLFADPFNPIGPLLLRGGKIYGTNYYGGSAGQGSVFVTAPVH